jgi:16S rRNA (uracil1498-N3)-methyltransferase
MCRASTRAAYTFFMPRVYLAPYVLEAGRDGDDFSLDADSAKKLTRVLRLTAGETFIAFDGLGGEWECALSAVGTEENSREVRATILSERLPPPPPKLHLCVAQAVPKGDKMEFVLQKGTELGVAEFWPFAGARSVANYDGDDDERASTRAGRWRKIAQQAAAQCGRADVPVVHALCDFATAVDYGTQSDTRCFMLDETPDIETLREALTREPLNLEASASTRETVPARVMLLVGPEGGWSEREREWAARYGVEAVSLGRLVLRTETAALAACAALQWEAGELG